MGVLNKSAGTRVFGCLLILIVYVILYPPTARQPSAMQPVNLVPPKNSGLSRRFVVDLGGNRLSVPSVVLRPIGGIGNQLFQYSCAFSVAKDLNIAMYLQHPALENRTFDSKSRSFALDMFQLPEPRGRSLGGGIILPEELTFPFTEAHLLRRTPFVGYKFFLLQDFCESELFFAKYADVLKKSYKPTVNASNIKDMVHRIKLAEESVAVHIRRGDFARTQLDRTIPIHYQIRAMSLMTSKLPTSPVFFIFSDDIGYARQQFQSYNLSDVIYVSGGNFSSVEEFFLISRCRHHIISNSTFSWWAAYLSSHFTKIVICPFPKYRDTFYSLFPDPIQRAQKRYIYEKFPYPIEWHCINPFATTV